MNARTNTFWTLASVCTLISCQVLAQTPPPPTQIRPWMQEETLSSDIQRKIDYHKRTNGGWTEADSARLAQSHRRGMANHWTWERESAWAKRNADRMAIGTNEVLLAQIRADFKALPRPLCKRAWKRRLNAFGGLLRGWDMELSDAAKAFCEKYFTVSETRSPLPLAVALYPLLDDPYYSGDVVLVLHPMAGSGAHLVGVLRYVSPTERGDYDEKGASVRQSARSSLRTDLWLDADGKPIVIPRMASRQFGVPAEECEDRTNRPASAVTGRTNGQARTP
jgi:hypothetical protein